MGISETIDNDPSLPAEPLNLAEAVDQVLTLRSVVNEGNVLALEEMGFDSELLPIMQMFASQGKIILGTYSHPTEVDAWKLIASTLLTNACKERGIPMNVVKVNQLDTRNTHEATKKPLSIGGFGLDPEDNPLLLLNPDQKQIADAAKKFIDLLTNDLVAEIGAMGMGKAQGKAIKSGIQTLLTSRLNDLVALMPQNIAVSDLETNMKMMRFNIDLAKLILGDNCDPDIIKNLGENLASEDLEWTPLIRASLQELIRIKGIEVIKATSELGKKEGVLFIHGQRKDGQIILNESNNFELDLEGQKRLLSDEEFIQLIPQGIPLGKLESLAMVAGGMMIHVGTDHGASAKALEILGIQGKASEQILKRMTFAEENMPIHDGIVFGKKLMPLQLMYLMLGADNLKALINSESPLIFTDIKDLRKFFARSLINQILATEA